MKILEFLKSSGFGFLTAKTFSIKYYKLTKDFDQDPLRYFIMYFSVELSDVTTFGNLYLSTDGTIDLHHGQVSNHDDFSFTMKYSYRKIVPWIQ